MKKIVFLLGIICILLVSCGKEETPFDPAKQAAADDVSIQAYLKANNITTAVKDASGLYYQIVTQGTGANPTYTSTVTVNYTGTFLDGSVFDSTTKSGAFTTALTAVIQGWTIGVPYVKTGGRIILYIPSGLGYGNSTVGVIPANSVTIFTIDLLSFK